VCVTPIGLCSLSSAGEGVIKEKDSQGQSNPLNVAQKLLHVSQSGLLKLAENMKFRSGGVRILGLGSVGT
jgi:hypothetical protein